MHLTPVSALRPVMTTAELRAVRPGLTAGWSAVAITTREALPLIAVGLLAVHRARVVSMLVALIGAARG
jgi:hypothetical protein